MLDLKTLSKGAMDTLKDIKEILVMFFRDGDARWVAFSLAIVFLLLAKAAGLHGLADVIAYFYIMFWITMDSPKR